MSGTGKESRAPVELRSAQLYELEAGCVIRVTLFLDREAALKAARPFGVVLWTKSSGTALHGKQ